MYHWLDSTVDCLCSKMIKSNLSPAKPYYFPEPGLQLHFSGLYGHNLLWVPFCFVLEARSCVAREDVAREDGLELLSLLPLAPKCQDHGVSHHAQIMWHWRSNFRAVHLIANWAVLLVLTSLSASQLDPFQSMYSIIFLEVQLYHTIPVYIP